MDWSEKVMNRFLAFIILSTLFIACGVQNTGKVSLYVDDSDSKDSAGYNSVLTDEKQQSATALQDSAKAKKGPVVILTPDTQLANYKRFDSISNRIQSVRSTIYRDTSVMRKSDSAKYLSKSFRIRNLEAQQQLMSSKLDSLLNRKETPGHYIVEETSHEDSLLAEIENLQSQLNNASGNQKTIIKEGRQKTVTRVRNGGTTVIPVPLPSGKTRYDTVMQTQFDTISSDSGLVEELILLHDIALTSEPIENLAAAWETENVIDTASYKGSDRENYKSKKVVSQFRYDSLLLQYKKKSINFNDTVSSLNKALRNAEKQTVEKEVKQPKLVKKAEPKVIKKPAFDTVQVDLLYDPGKKEPQNLSILKEALNELSKQNIYRIFISSYTDSSGNSMLNLSLSQKRVQEIKNYLTSAGVDNRLIFSQAFGEQYASNPILDRERRMEVEILVKP
jgi:outer membrane protein OmpA-like peptidoglycan-associated protein